VTTGCKVDLKWGSRVSELKKLQAREREEDLQKSVLKSMLQNAHNEAAHKRSTTCVIVFVVIAVVVGT